MMSDRVQVAAVLATVTGGGTTQPGKRSASTFVHTGCRCVILVIFPCRLHGGGLDPMARARMNTITRADKAFIVSHASNYRRAAGYYVRVVPGLLTLGGDNGPASRHESCLTCWYFFDRPSCSQVVAWATPSPSSALVTTLTVAAEAARAKVSLPGIDRIAAHRLRVDMVCCRRNRLRGSGCWWTRGIRQETGTFATRQHLPSSMMCFLPCRIVCSTRKRNGWLVTLASRPKSRR